ncbi:transmembrane protein 79-like [Cololabis saira]|uniref:transmembrane protein 79-like n=1 Tax=Cololabis saira TaxID=129043 RepID=UPI002AD1D1D2|nr:transmembrane protein 79-like [Cololabis saira]
MEDGGGLKTSQAEGGVGGPALPEPSTLRWPGDTCGQEVGQEVGRPGNGDRSSVRSDSSLREASSWTESERGLKGGRGLSGGGATGEGAGLPAEGRGLSLQGDEDENRLPEKAAQVFSPAVTVLPSPSPRRDSEAFWETESEKSPFLDHSSPDYNQDGYHQDGYHQDGYQQGYRYEWSPDGPRRKCGCCCSRDTLKVGVSLMSSALLFPFLLWGGFVFLPFDAPPMDGAPLRLVYALRCSVFAAAPIVLGWLVLGVSRLRFGAVRPLFEDALKGAELGEVTVHRRFVHHSTSLFVLYFLQLVVMAMYLRQEQLKLLPLLTVLFAFGRLSYWVAAAYGSSVRGFGFGLSFLPSVAMMAANFYFIFTVEAGGSVFSLPPGSEGGPARSGEGFHPAGRPRFWG